MEFSSPKTLKCKILHCLVQAGEYLLSAWSEDAHTARAETHVMCKPSKTSPLHCRSDMSGLTDWRAGQLGRLVIIRKDRYATCNGQGCKAWQA